MFEPRMSLPFGIAILDQMTILDCNAEFAHILGFLDPNETLAKVTNVLSLIAPSDRQEIRNELELSQLGFALPQAHLCNLIHTTSKSVPAALLFESIEWNQLPAIKLTVIDTQYVHNSYLDVREQDQMFRDMILHSAQGILVHRNFKPLFVNQSWVELQGATSVKQVLAMASILDLVPKNQQQQAQQHYAKVIQHKCSSASTVVENIGLDGVSRYFNIYDNVIMWQGEKAVQVVLEDVSDKVVLEKQLKYQATHDDLTQLYNRRAIYQWVEQTIKQGQSLICLLIDIDNFKVINDTHGHIVGDDVICALADTTKQIISQTGGVVGRWGGEEFIVLLPSQSPEMAQQVAQDICDSFKRLSFTNQQRQRFNSSVSIGVAYSDTPCMASVDNLITRTDQHLYTAKANGKNQVVCQAIPSYQ